VEFPFFRNQRRKGDEDGTSTSKIKNRKRKKKMCMKTSGICSQNDRTRNIKGQLSWKKRKEKSIIRT